MHKPGEDHEFEHDRPLHLTPRSVFPGANQLPYRSDLLAALVGIKTIWAMPEYTLDLFQLAEPELDLTESTVLYILGYRGPLRPMDLGDLLAMRRSNVSKVLNRLETRGLVERRADDADKRSVRVHLTESGMRASKRLYQVGDVQVAELTKGWTQKELREFAAYSARFADSAKDLAERLRRGELPKLPADDD